MIGEIILTTLVMLPCMTDTETLADRVGGEAKPFKAGNYLHGHWCLDGLCLDPHGDEHIINIIDGSHESHKVIKYSYERL